MNNVKETIVDTTFCSCISSSCFDWPVFENKTIWQVRIFLSTAFKLWNKENSTVPPSSL